MTFSRGRENAHAATVSRGSVEKLVGQLVQLSRSDEACRLLGVDGALLELVDITVLEDPIDYVSYDIAAAIRDAGEDAAPVRATFLSTLIAELRFCGLIVSHLDQLDLVERVMRHLQELEG